MKYKGAVFFDYDGTLADDRCGIHLPTETTRKALKKLSDREQKIISLRFGINTNSEEKTQKEVADLMGISQSYISRLEKKIMRRLKKEIVRFE